jgi:hypothetical protein
MSKTEEGWEAKPAIQGARCEFPDFRTFVDWAVSQVGYGKGFELDKDLLSGDKVYSPTTCLYLPRELNVFVKAESVLQSGPYPCGVTYCNNTNENIYRARCSDGNRSVSLGCYPTPEAAHAAYTIYKASVAKKLADKFKDQIDPRAYVALRKISCQ